MADYKEMYLRLFRAAEQAVRLLTEAQQACEEMYLSSTPRLIELPREDQEK